MRRPSAWAAAWALMLAATTAYAGNPDSTSFELSPASGAWIGSPLAIEGTVRYPRRYALTSDLAGRTTGSFAITKIEMSPPQPQGEAQTQAVRLTVVPFDTGQQTLPPLPWLLTETTTPSPSSQPKSRTLLSPPVRLMVGGPVIEPGADIRDIQPPLAPLVWPFLLLAAALLAVALLAAIRMKRRWRRGTALPIGTQLDTRPPHEIALTELERLRSLNIDTKQYYSRLADILRLYLERRFGIPAMVLTTTDLIRQMRQAEIDPAATGSTRLILDRADLVKFAKLRPVPQEKEGDLTAAIQIVEATAPPPSPVSAATAASPAPPK